jgi:hypothetical protein
MRDSPTYDAHWSSELLLPAPFEQVREIGSFDFDPFLSEVGGVWWRALPSVASLAPVFAPPPPSHRALRHVYPAAPEQVHKVSLSSHSQGHSKRRAIYRWAFNFLIGGWGGWKQCPVWDSCLHRVPQT